MLIKDEQLTLDPGDRGLLYGFSLFETMLVKKGRVVMLQRHLERLTGSAAVLDMTLTGVTDLLAARCNEAVERSSVVDGVLRLTVTAGPAEGGEGTVLLSIREGVPYLPDRYEKGFSLLTLGFPRHERSPLVRHKTTNYMENLLGRREALRLGYDEGLFLNTSGNVAEGTVSNIFVVREGELLTPPLEAGLLPGTVRRLVLERATGLGYRCRKTNITLDDLKGADECFLTNSLMGIMPATHLDGTVIGSGKPGPVTLDIIKVYPPVPCFNTK